MKLIGVFISSLCALSLSSLSDARAQACFEQIPFSLATYEPGARENAAALVAFNQQVASISADLAFLDSKRVALAETAQSLIWNAEPPSMIGGRLLDSLPINRRLSLEGLVLEFGLRETVLRVPEAGNASALLMTEDRLLDLPNLNQGEAAWTLSALNSLVSFHKNGEASPHCNGVLISQTEIATALHCLGGQSSAEAGTMIKVTPKLLSGSHNPIICGWTVSGEYRADEAKVDGVAISVDVSVVEIDTSGLSEELQQDLSSRAVSLTTSFMEPREEYAMAMHWPWAGTSYTNDDKCGLSCYGLTEDGKPVYPELMQRLLVQPRESLGCNSAISIAAGNQSESDTKKVKVWDCPTRDKTTNALIHRPGWPHNCPQPEGASGAPFFVSDLQGVPRLIGIASAAMTLVDPDENIPPPENCMAPTSAVIQ
ncbi:MAG: hypothetical protein AAFO74_15995 [Pseudomonadota bacterium]